MHSYAWRELVRNPRRTLAAMTGVALGVGLFSAVLFFIDGSGATMTARAVAPLALDMQRVLTAPLGSGLRLEERLGATGSISAGEPVTITLRVINGGAEPAHDVVVEDVAPAPLRYLAGTATLERHAASGRGRRRPVLAGGRRAGTQHRHGGAGLDRHHQLPRPGTARGIGGIPAAARSRLEP